MINGIGSGVNNQGVHGHVHRVTECVHADTHKMNGGTAASARMSVGESVQTITEQEPRLNLLQWVEQLLRRTGGGIKSFFGIGTGAGTEGNDAAVAAAAGQEVVTQLLPDQKTAADRASYFVPAGVLPPKNSWFHNLKTKIGIRFGEIRRSLARHLKQEQSLQTGTGRQGSQAQRKKENRSRLSVFRQEEQEIECIITDDSYLLDSYNKKGDYSKLGSRD